MNTTHLSSAACVLAVCSVAIPLISAWLTAHASATTGWITVALAGLGGVASDLAAHGGNDITWQALLNALLAWAVAGGTHLLVTRPKDPASPTGPEAQLHAIGPQLGKAA